jgi:hypothetical protein
MALNCFFDPLRFDADISLRHGGGTLLQKPPDQGNIKAGIAALTAFHAICFLRTRLALFWADLVLLN